MITKVTMPQLEYRVHRDIDSVFKTEPDIHLLHEYIKGDYTSNTIYPLELNLIIKTIGKINHPWKYEQLMQVSMLSKTPVAFKMHVLRRYQIKEYTLLINSMRELYRAGTKIFQLMPIFVIRLKDLEKEQHWDYYSTNKGLTDLRARYRKRDIKGKYTVIHVRAIAWYNLRHDPDMRPVKFFIANLASESIILI